jgi:site-specific DNA-methyltransferase (adenine-specific)
MSDVKIYNEDCMVAMARMRDKEFDLAICDPPYGIGCAKTINIENKKKGFIHRELHTAKQWDNKRPNGNYFSEIQRISQFQIIWGANYFTDFLYPVKGWIVWDKKENQTQGSYFSDGEMAWTNINTPLRIFKYGWIGVDYINHPIREIKIHPTQKPVALYQWLLKNYAKPGDKILDTHLGSGSSAIAADIMGFDFTGYEIDRDYYEAALERFNRHKQQTVLEFV